MQTVIFRTLAPYLTGLMLILSVFVLLRGHNEPGGGFTGGLVAASAFAMHSIAFGVPAVRRLFHFHPMAIAGFGLFIAVLAGFPSLVYGLPFLTALWSSLSFLGISVDLSTVMAFEIGIYLIVVGSISSIILALENREHD